MTRARSLWLAPLLVACVGRSTPVANADESPQREPAAVAASDAHLVELLAQESTSSAALRLAYAQYLSIAPSGPERTRRAVEYAELLLAVEQFDEAALHLRNAFDSDELDLHQRARAARSLLEALVVRWKATPVGEPRLAAATAIRELLIELQTERELWQLDDPISARLRDLAPSLLVTIGWDLALTHKHLGLEHGGREAFSACAEELIELFNSFPDYAEPGPLLAEAADCATRAYQVTSAITLRRALIDRYPDSPLAPDATFSIAETYENVLSFREALRFYREFAERYPDDQRAALARARWLQLALTLDEPIAEIIATWTTWATWGATSQARLLDERTLAAAVEFRAAQQAGELAALSDYLARRRREGGPAREIAVRVALATEAMRRSCPDAARATGLCTLQTADGRLGEVLRRDKQEQREAERQLRVARALMADPSWKNDPLEFAGPPLALGPEELLELEAAVALLVGDLSAEEALRVQPPRTYEASRTRIWLTERERSVAEMVAAYETVGHSDPARAAAAAERSAQVYESDATLLARVELELRERGDTKLAQEIDRLEAERLSQALAAYQQCLASISAYGDDPAEVQRACKRGVGRLCGRFEVEVPWTDDSSLGALTLGAN